MSDMPNGERKGDMECWGKSLQLKLNGQEILHVKMNK